MPFNRSMHCWPNMQEQSNLASCEPGIHPEPWCLLSVMFLSRLALYERVCEKYGDRVSAGRIADPEFMIPGESVIPQPYIPYRISLNEYHMIAAKTGVKTFQHVMLRCEILLGFAGRARRHRSHPSKGKVAVLCPVHRCRCAHCFSKNMCRLIR